MKQKFNLRFFMTFVVGLLMSVSALAQNITVKGHVKDDLGEIAGATILQKGTSNGCITDFDGNFTLSVPKGATLVISFVGYSSQEVKATGAPINILLREDSKMLTETVVIGYGSVKKNDMTGSVVAIKPDEKNHGMITSAQEMIQGKIAGVNVTTTSGEPGAGAEIRIRGGASLNATNNPLIVIDGMPMDNNATKGMSNPLSLVNPNDIESFTVLKDASATAIYGSRGSNGVVIITTKKGKKGASPKLSYSGNVSFSQVAKKLNLMNAAEYTEFMKNKYGEESSAYNGLGWKEYNEDGTPNYAAGTYDTDWQKEIFRTGVSHDHNVSLTGGIKTASDNFSMPYRVSLGYTGQNGILKESNYNRFTAGFNLSPSLLKDHLNINLNGKYSYSKTRPGNGSAIGAAVSMDPTRPVYSDDPAYSTFGGYWQWIKSTSSYDPTFPYERNQDAPTNPVEKVYNSGFYKSSNILIGNAEFDYKIHGLEDLRLHANFAGEYADGGEYTELSPYTTGAFYYGNKSENKEKKYNLIATAYAQYYKDFNDNHHLDVMAGYEYSKTHYKGDSWSLTNYPTTFLGKDDQGNALAGTVKSYDETPWEGQMFLVSWYGRANYTLLNRYLFTFTARYDGSSRFSDGHRWGFFPSAAAAWRIKDEKFMENVDAISDFKLRLGWGKTGQQDTGKEYYTATYKHSVGTHYLYPVGQNNAGVLYRPLAYNDDLTWETTTTYNIGLDYGMFNQRLTLSADVYMRKTTDLLCTPTIPAGQNFDNAILLNAGSLENKGVEVAITGKPIQTKDWFLELSVNAAYNKNKITELYGGRDMIEAGLKAGTDQQLTYHKVGNAANAFYVFQQVYDESGRPIMGAYVDQNADGIIDDNDKYFYKSITAPWTGGFAIKLSYKKWDIGTNFHGSFGNYVYNAIEQGKANSSVLYNSKGYYENSTKEFTELGWSSYNYPLSDYFVQNGSFLRCDNITLGYNFDNFLKAGKYNGISGRIYASCSNVFTITKYKGLDPEQTSGMESSSYPRCRTYLIGVNLNF